MMATQGLAAHPQPLVSIIGDVVGQDDVHQRLVAALDLCLIAADLERNKIEKINYNVHPAAHAFSPAKKIESKSRRDSLEKDILKEGWMEKHVSKRPSVVIMLCGFNVNWNDQEWEQKEAEIQSQYINHRTNLFGRNCKLLLVAVKTGDAATGIDQEKLADRKNGLVTALQLDSYSFDMLAIQDFDGRDNGGRSDVPIQNFFIKVYKYSMNYYAMQVKGALNRLEDCIAEVMAAYATGGGTDELGTASAFGDPMSPGGGKGVRARDVSYLGLARARYNYKAAFYCDFQGLPQYALGYYRNSFQSLVGVTESLDEDLRGMARRLAEKTSYRICDYHIRLGDDNAYYALQTVQTRERDAEIRQAHTSANKQFELLIKSFKTFDSYDDSQARHAGWMCRQYLLHLGLLSTRRMLLGGQGMDVSEMFLLAAHTALQLGGESGERGSISRLISNGSPGEHGEATSPAEMFMHALGLHADTTGELALVGVKPDMDHPALVAFLLEKAYRTTPEKHTRRKANILALQCEQSAQAGNFVDALLKLEPMVQELASGQWVSLAVPLLRRKMSCAAFLGRLEDYLDGALRLYSHAMAGMGQSVLGRYDIEELHRDLLSVVGSFGRSVDGEEPVVVDPTTSPFSRPANYVGVPWRPEFGMCFDESDGVEDELGGISYVLPQGYSVTCSAVAESVHPCLFEVHATFDDLSKHAAGSSVEVQLHITSRFYGIVHVAELSVNWTMGVFHQRFVNTSDGAASSAKEEAGKQVIGAPLNFMPRETVTLSFSLLLEGQGLEALLGLGGGGGALLCIESVDFVLRSTFAVDAGSGKVGAPPGSITSGGSSPRDLSAPSSSSSAAAAAATPVKSLPGDTNSSCAPESETRTPVAESRDVVFHVQLLPDRVADELQKSVVLPLPSLSSSSSSSGGVLGDYAGSAGGRNCSEDQRLRVLRVARPEAAVRIVWPSAAADRLDNDGGAVTVGSGRGGTLMGPLRASANAAAAVKTEGIRLLAGAVQRIDLVFDACGEDLEGCGVTMAAPDGRTPDTVRESLFWWPKPSTGSASVSDADTGPDTEYCPMRIDDTTGQPSARVALSPSFCGRPGHVSVPLFLRSSSASSEEEPVAVRVCLTLRSGFVKEFVLPVTFAKPLEVTFHVQHSGDLWPGVRLLKLGEGEVLALLGKSGGSSGTSGNEQSPKSGSSNGGSPRTPPRANRGLSPLKASSVLDLPRTRPPSSDGLSPAPIASGGDVYPAATTSAAALVDPEPRPMVVFGDTLLVTAELACVESLGGDIEVNQYKMHRGTVGDTAAEGLGASGVPRVPSFGVVNVWSAADSIQPQQEGEAEKKGDTEGNDIPSASNGGISTTQQDNAQIPHYCSFSGGERSVDLMREACTDPSDDEVVCTLGTGECLVGLADVICGPAGRLSLETIDASITQSMADAGGSGRPGQLQVPAVEASFGHVAVTWRVGNSGSTSSSSSPLPMLTVGDGDSSSPVDESVSMSTMNVTTFDMPSVTLVDPPFEVTVQEPTRCRVGEPATMKVNFTSNMWSMERLSLSLGGDVANKAPTDFLVAGAASQGLVVAPRGSATASVSLVPLRCGNVPLPKLTVSWGRFGCSVLSLNRSVYVSPGK
jgi:hypothetical protein